MAVDLSKVHVNRALSDLSVLLMSQDDTYLVPRVCARRPVDQLSGNFFQYGREAAQKSDTAALTGTRSVTLSSPTSMWGLNIT